MQRAAWPCAAPCGLGLWVQFTSLNSRNDRSDDSGQRREVFDLHGIHALGQFERLAAVANLEEHFPSSIREPTLADMTWRIDAHFFARFVGAGHALDGAERRASDFRFRECFLLVEG